MLLKFTKMHGLGNDFVVIDAVTQNVRITASMVRRLADRKTGIGCDQVLEHGGALLSKPTDIADARAQLRALRGQTHKLLSAAVIYGAGKPLWRHVGTVRLRMHDLSDDYIDAYLDRNWNSIRHAVGCYKLEEEGARLFSRIDGDYFTVLGLPLLEVLSYLTLRGTLPR